MEDSSSDARSINVATSDNSNEIQSSRVAKLVMSESFENGKSQPGWSEIVFTEQNYSNAPKFVKVHGKWSAHYHLLGGTNAENEQQPLLILKDDFTDWFGTPEVEELYIEHSEFWDDNYDSPTGSQKMIRIGRYVNNDPTGPYLDFWNQIANTNIQIFHYFRGANNSADNSLSFNTQRGLDKGTWIRFGNWVKLNSKGESNGFVRLYIDGTLTASINNADLRGENPQGYRFFWLGGNATYWQPDVAMGHPARPKNNSSRYITDIKVYNTKPNTD